VFLNKAKNLNMIDLVFNIATEINLIIENMVMYKDIQIISGSNSNLNSNSSNVSEHNNGRKISATNVDKSKKNIIEI